MQLIELLNFVLLPCYQIAICHRSGLAHPHGPDQITQSEAPSLQSAAASTLC